MADMEPQEYLSGYVDTRLNLIAAKNIGGVLAGNVFVKVVVERETKSVHFINNHNYQFHVDYIAESIMNVKREQVRATIDEFNERVYLSPDRSYYLGIVSLQTNRHGEDFFVLETVEIDNMDEDMLRDFFATVRSQLDPAVPLMFKPANHEQEAMVASIDPVDLPRILNHELFASQAYVPLNSGEARGRLRYLTEKDYNPVDIQWYDIVVMDRVPDTIPRVSGIINSRHTTPLSHTNVLASGWQIPNSTKIGVEDQILEKELNGAWVRYCVDFDSDDLILEEIEASDPDSLEQPVWSVHAIRLEEPETEKSAIAPLRKLRMTDRVRYGTKGANLGELQYILEEGSNKLTGFYRIPRPPRDNLIPYLASYLGTDQKDNLNKRAAEFLNKHVKIPRGIAIPFSYQIEFLEGSPRIQQAIGKLKMALELEVKEIDSLCLQLQQLIRKTKMSDSMRDRIDEHIANELAGVSSFVVRSSSNAEDLKDFSAAGIYESMNHVTTADTIFQSIKEVWASLLSPRSVRLRHQVGISLDDSYMGVVIQEEVSSDMGGVLVTCNPMNPEHDFRNVFINASDKSAVEVVEGAVLPYQYLYNTLEGGGRTLSIGSAKEDLSEQKKALLQNLGMAGRLLQSHFSQSYTFEDPADIEWAAHGDQLYILQLRPYGI